MLKDSSYRYELRRYTDSTQSKYTVIARSNDMNSLTAFKNRSSVPNNDYYNLTVVDLTND